MAPEVREFLERLVKNKGSEDPYEVDDPIDLYCGNEDDARELGEEHVRYEIGKLAEELLMKEVQERWPSGWEWTADSETWENVYFSKKGERPNYFEPTMEEALEVAWLIEGIKRPGARTATGGS